MFAKTARLGFLLALCALAGCKKSGDEAKGTDAKGTEAKGTRAPAPSVDISGTYAATGTNMNGKGAYQASLTVKKQEQVYQFSWTSGPNRYDGVGVQTGSSVAVSYTEGADGKGCGVVLYEIAGDGSLDGKAGYWGVNQQETEKATRKTGTDLEGTYAVTGRSASGKDYQGELTVKADGQGFAFDWKTAVPLQGFGTRSGNMVAAGFGGAKCAFVLYDVKPDGTLDGKWGTQGAKSFGQETAKKQ